MSCDLPCVIRTAARSSVGVLIGGVAVLNGLVRGQVVVAAKDCQRALAVKHDEGPCPPDVCRIEG
jgi:hypothetical protein